MRVAIAQTAPVFLDRERTLTRVVEWIERAGAAGAQLVTFGEGFVPGYPLWLEHTNASRWNAADQKELFALYVRESVRIEDGHLKRVCDAAARARCAVVLGVIEKPLDRGGHTLFATRVFIDASGQIVSTHRKLSPTYDEKLVWSHGDGAGLVTHQVGPLRVSALNCWENWMPLARATLYAAGTELHVMIWPGSRAITHELTRFVALEGRCFVISASAIYRNSDFPIGVPSRDRFVTGEWIKDGGSCIAGPDGKWIVEPLVEREELIVAELDPLAVSRERQNFDPAGHYARPDVFRLTVNARRATNVERSES